jgi:uncharacterized protein (DUF697 family)
MPTYEERIQVRLTDWERKLLMPPNLLGRTSKQIQTRINKAIPEKVHAALTSAVKGIVRTVQFGLEVAPKTPPLAGLSLEERDIKALELLSTYKKIAAAEGAGTGAGGFVLSLVDFPALIAIKLRFLFELAHVYGFSTKDVSERLFVLYLFQLAFSSGEVRARTLRTVKEWNRTLDLEAGPSRAVSLQSFDWDKFQMEYRDTIDFRKMLQLVPGIGAVVGAWANYGLLEELGEAAMNGYRIRWLTLPE